MWKCHKCGKPVYFAERKQSLGYNWHPECLRCEECGKRLNPGQHAEHKGVPYCHVPCYGALFGPQLFGHGTRVESHKSFGLQKDVPKVGNGPTVPRAQVESKLKAYNQFFEGKSGEVRSREVNGRLVLEGSLRIHWGVQAVIHLKENDDQRTVVTVRKRNSCRISMSTDNDTDDDVQSISRDTSYNDISSCSDISTSLELNQLNQSDTGIEIGLESTDTSTVENSPSTPPFEPLPKSVTLPSKLNVKNLEWDELDELLQVERKFDECDKIYQTMPVPLPSQSSTETTSSSQSNDDSSSKTESPPDTNSTATTTETATLQNPLLSNGTNTTTTSDLTTPKDDHAWLETSNHLNRSMSGPDCLARVRHPSSPEFDRSSTTDMSSMSEALGEVVVRRPAKTGSTAIRRRPGKRLSRSKVKRRCSINGHFYDRETSFFTPPHGSQMSVWVTSLVNTQEVINLMLDKYKVDSDGSNFALFVVWDNGEQRRLKDEEYPLLTRVLLGPHEDVSNLYLMDSHSTLEVSSEVAQFLNFSLTECRAILNQYYSQEEKEVARLKEKYLEMKRRIVWKMNEIKTNL